MDAAFTSYAQNYEDVILWRSLKSVRSGFYIDVGAHDPEIFSTSLGFYEKGWRGINVEPLPDFAERFRRERRDDHVIQAAVGKTAGPLTFHNVGGTGLSTGVPEMLALLGDLKFEIEPISVDVIPLSRIFEIAGARDIHFLKIDVEGMEQDVLESWGDSPARPWIVVVESTLPNSQTPTHENWDHLLVELDYNFVYFDGLNRFYVHADHRDLQANFGPGPNVFDNFSYSEKGDPIPARPLVWRLQGLEKSLAEAERQRTEDQLRLSDLDMRLQAADAKSADLEHAVSAAVQESLRLKDVIERQDVKLLDLEQDLQRNAADMQRLDSELADSREAASAKQAEARQLLGEVEDLSRETARVAAALDEERIMNRDLSARLDAASSEAAKAVAALEEQTERAKQFAAGEADIFVAFHAQTRRMEKLRMDRDDLVTRLEALKAVQ